AGCSRAAPATASTLSTDIETSASTIWITDWRSVLTGGPVRTEPEGPQASSASAISPACWRISRNIFQQTHMSRMPPASSSPTSASSMVANPASAMRSTVAAAMPMTIALRRLSRGSPAAAMPTTTALSLASTRSMNTTWTRTNAQAKSSCIGARDPVGGDPDVLDGAPVIGEGDVNRPVRRGQHARIGEFAVQPLDRIVRKAIAATGLQRALNWKASAVVARQCNDQRRARHAPDRRTRHAGTLTVLFFAIDLVVERRPAF